MCTLVPNLWGNLYIHNPPSATWLHSGDKHGNGYFVGYPFYILDWLYSHKGHRRASADQEAHGL